MPNRNKSNIKNHKGKLTYVSRNYQRDWSVDPKEDTVKVTTDVELDIGDKVVIETDIPKISETKPEPKKSKRKKDKNWLDQNEC